MSLPHSTTGAAMLIANRGNLVRASANARGLVILAAGLNALDESRTLLRSISYVEPGLSFKDAADALALRRPVFVDVSSSAGPTDAMFANPSSAGKTLRAANRVRLQRASPSVPPMHTCELVLVAFGFAASRGDANGPSPYARALTALRRMQWADSDFGFGDAPDADVLAAVVAAYCGFGRSDNGFIAGRRR